MNENERKLVESVSESLNLISERQKVSEHRISSVRNDLFWSILSVVALIIISNLFMQRMQLNAKIYEQNRSNLMVKKELRDKITTTLSGSQFLLNAQYAQCKRTQDNQTLVEQKIARNNILPSLTSINVGTSDVFSPSVEKEIASYENRFESIDNICLLDIKKFDSELKKQISEIIFDMNQRIEKDSKN